MERNPLRLAWTAAPGRHLAAVACLLPAGVLLATGLDLVRALTDSLLLGRPTSALIPALDPTPAIEAVTGGRSPLALVALVVTIPFFMALCLVAVRWAAAGIGARAVEHVREAVLEALIAAPASARDEAGAAASIAGEALSQEGTTLGAAILTPLQSGGAVALSLGFTALVDWRLALVTGAMLLVSTGLSALRIEKRIRAGQARASTGRRVDGFLGDLLRRLPALRAHGTGPFERERLLRGLRSQQRAVKTEERRLAFVEGLSIAALLLTPLNVLAAGTLLGAESASPGEVIAATLAAALASWSVREIARWQRHQRQARPVLAETARSVSQLQARGRLGGTAALPGVGALVAQGVSAYDPANGGRISGIDLSFTCPAHVAVVGAGEPGPRILAALIGGQLEPSTGRLTFGGVDLAKVGPVERARRIAYAGGETVLIPGTLRQNLAYGSQDERDLDARLMEAVAVAGLDRLVHGRGLAGTLDAAREPKLAATIVETRRAVREGLARDGLDRYVDPFDAGQYNHHATIGENLLFGQPIGDTFRDVNLPSHPFVRAVLEAEDLTKPLAAVGLQIATSMTEIFAEIPEGSPLFQRFSFFSAGDRAFFEDLLERRTERRRGTSTGRDRERLIGLALRYSESRHRLGLIDDDLRARLLKARTSFAAMLPVSLQPAIEFYDEARLCTAASVQDNLLFGRIASDQAGAEAAVQAVIRRALTERGLDADVTRIGLDMPVNPSSSDFTTGERTAIDLVRGLVRRPDMLVVERALDGLPGPAADALVARLRRALVGRGLVIVTSQLPGTMDSPAFDAVIRFDRGAAQVEHRRQQMAELMPA